MSWSCFIAVWGRLGCSKWSLQTPTPPPTISPELTPWPPSSVSFSRSFLFFSFFTLWSHPSHPLIPVMTTRGWTCHSAGLSPLLPPPAVFTESRQTPLIKRRHGVRLDNEDVVECRASFAAWSSGLIFSSCELTLGRCSVRDSSLLSHSDVCFHCKSLRKFGATSLVVGIKISVCVFMFWVRFKLSKLKMKWWIWK